MSKEQKAKVSANAQASARDYDFKVLTDLLSVWLRLCSEEIRYALEKEKNDEDSAAVGLGGCYLED